MVVHMVTMRGHRTDKLADKKLKSLVCVVVLAPYRCMAALATQRDTWSLPPARSLRLHVHHAVFLWQKWPFFALTFFSLCLRVLILSTEPPAPRVGIEEINNKGAGTLHVPGATVKNGLQADYKGYWIATLTTNLSWHWSCEMNSGFQIGIGSWGNRIKRLPVRRKEESRSRKPGFAQKKTKLSWSFRRADIIST